MGGRNIEVEMKARVDEPAVVEERLKARARFLDEIDFSDTYFCRAEVEGYTYERFRLRITKDRALVTAKEKLEGRGEANVEHEFEVSDADAFKSFVLLHGFRVLIEKRKRGRRYVMEPGAATVEAVNVEGLGDFIEVEIMVADESAVGPARERIGEVFEELGVPASDLETRAYTLLLYELEHGEVSAR
jgi:predicted adenylyl cyclase CyaB